MTAAHGAEQPAARLAGATPNAASRGQRWFDGLTWKGVGLLAFICLVNALRRNSDELARGALARALVDGAFQWCTTLILAMIVALAVLASYGRLPSRPWLRYPMLAMAILLSTLVGVVFLLVADARFMPDSNPDWGWRDVMTMWPRYALLSALLAAVYVFFRRAEDSAREAYTADEERRQMLQQMDEAHLLVLQAQIEPHFLFNTLATVRRLYHTDPAVAGRVFDSLMGYLASALPQMRATHSTVGREVALTTAYLDVQRIRMGERLTVVVECERGLEQAHMPPMMLLTLVENAIKHGLSPLPRGGSLQVRVRREGDRMRVEVSDTGDGLMPTAGGGTGLANVAARLAATYGDAAQLVLSVNHPRGVTAALAFPCAECR